MVRVLFIILFTGISFNIYGQPLLKNCLFITDKDKHVLSETIRFDDGYGNGHNQTFNSLFIWQKDKVIRLIFKYVKEMPGNAPTQQIQSFNNFIPLFKKYKVYYHAKVNRVIDIGEEIYGGSIIYSKKNDNNADNYTTLLKIEINNWNKKHNIFADKLASRMVYDGEPEFLLKNKKRKEEYVNNLPLVFSMGDSLYLIKPYIINVYRLDNAAGATAASSSQKRYKLYSTVSLMEDSFWDSGVHANLEQYIRKNTLPWLYKMSLPLNTDSLFKFLSTFPMADYKKHAFREGIKEIEPIPIVEVQTIKRIKRRDSIRAAYIDSLRKIDESNCFGHYQYCPECYNSNISKAERIKMHCPVKIARGEYQFNENWSYAFSAKGMNYFKVEIELYYDSIFDGDPGEVTQNNYPVKWLMMSPGVGYWMTDVAKSTKEYFMLEKSKLVFMLDGKSAY